MEISYQKLWVKVKENKMKKKDLESAANISSFTVSKLKNNQPVSMSIMMRLCKVFHCDIGDICEVIIDE